MEDSIPYGIEPEGAEDSEIVLSMEELKDMAEVLSSAEEDLMGDQVPHEELADAVVEPPSIEDEMDVSSTEITASLEEEVSLSDLEELLEELVVDIEPQKSGWAGTPEDIMKYKEELKLAQLAATEAKEENLELVAARDRLSEQNKKMKEIITVLKEKVEKANLANAKLLYTNQVLANTSLNERQKDKIVEAISNATSVEEAKIIFETLQSAVGLKSKKNRKQESLNEVVTRSSSAFIPRKEAKPKTDAFSDRMKRLAGLK